eukprot:2817156-Rhodomonas_salina.4
MQSPEQGVGYPFEWLPPPLLDVHRSRSPQMRVSRSFETPAQKYHAPAPFVIPLEALTEIKAHTYLANHGRVLVLEPAGVLLPVVGRRVGEVLERAMPLLHCGQAGMSVRQQVTEIPNFRTAELAGGRAT